MTMLDSPKIEGQPGRAPSEPELVIKEARRRQRRRWLAGGALVLVVAVGASIGSVELDSGRTGINASTRHWPSSDGGVAGSVRSAPHACGVLSTTEATQLLGSPASGEAFTDLGFPVSPEAAPNPTYSQCRFTTTASQSQIRVIINASPAKSPSLSEEAMAAEAQPDSRVFTIDGAVTVWRPWTQQDLRGQGGVLDSTKNDDYVSVVLIYLHHDPISVAERVMQIVLPKLG
jgi:hypothetical protein